MTTFNSSSNQNNIFPAKCKEIKFDKKNIVLTSGANVLANMDLCDVHLDFEQYQKINVQIPKGQVNFLLTFPTLGIKYTFLVIKVNYCTNDSKNKYLKWKFVNSSDTKKSFTKMLLFTATTANPLEQIYLDNPDPNYPVNIEIIVAAIENDYLNDVNAHLYLDNLVFTNIQTLNNDATGILTFYDSTNTLAGSVDISDISNFNRIPGRNRIIIDDSSANNIILDFVNEYNTLQALSAINWVTNDPSTRALPKPADTLAPVVTYKPIVVGSNINIELSDYLNNTYNKQDFINMTILNVIDNIDGPIVPTVNNITFVQGMNSYPNIINEGLYTCQIKINDIAGNIFYDEITINAVLTVTDTIAPTITYTNNVNTTTNVISSLSLTTYSNIISKSDLILYSILNVTDNIDNTIPLSSIVCSIFDTTNTTYINNITMTGNYIITFSVSDSSSNTTSINLTLTVTI